MLTFRREIWIIWGLMILQLALCLPVLNSFPIGLDEPFSIFYAQQNPSEIWEMLGREDNPPLHFYLLHYWMNLFGDSAWSVRSLSLLFSTLTIPVLWKLGRHFLNRDFTVVFILMFILSTFNHYHAVEARTYSLLVLLFALILFELKTLLFEGNFSVWRFMLWNALILYTHYLAAIVIGVEIALLIVLFRKLTWNKTFLVFLSWIVSAVLYIPGIKLLLVRSSNYSDKGTWVPEPHWSELYGNINRFCNSKYAVVAFAVMVLVAAVWNYRKTLHSFLSKTFTSKFWFATVAFGVPYFGMYVLSIAIVPVSIFLDRYLLFTTIPLFLALTILMESASGDKLNSWKSLVFILPFAFTCKYLPDSNRADDELAAYVRSIRNDKSLILICPDFYYRTFMYHYDIEAFRDYTTIREHMSNSGIWPACFWVAGLDSFDNQILIDTDGEALDGLELLQSENLLNDSTFAGNFHVTQLRIPKNND